MRIFGKTGLFGADRWGLGRALAVRGVRGGAANRAKTGGEQFYISVKTAKSCRIALFSMVSGVLRVRHGRFSILQKTDLQLNQNSAKIKRFHLGLQRPRRCRFLLRSCRCDTSSK